VLFNLCDAPTGADETTLWCGWQARCGRARMRKSCFVVSIFLTSSTYLNTTVFCETWYSKQRKICRHCAQIDISNISTEKCNLRKFLSVFYCYVSMETKYLQVQGKHVFQARPRMFWYPFFSLLQLHKTSIPILYVSICVLSPVQGAVLCRNGTVQRRRFDAYVSAMDVSAMKCEMCFPLECHQSAKIRTVVVKRVGARFGLALVSILQQWGLFTQT